MQQEMVLSKNKKDARGMQIVTDQTNKCKYTNLIQKCMKREKREQVNDRNTHK